MNRARNFVVDSTKRFTQQILYYYVKHILISLIEFKNSISSFHVLIKAVLSFYNLNSG